MHTNITRAERLFRCIGAKRARAKFQMSTKSKSIENKGWNMMEIFYANLRREFIEDRLKEDGDFLLRRNQNGDAVVLSVLWKGKVRHYSPVMRMQTNRRPLYSFGQKEFSSVSELIEYHWKRRVPLPDQFKTLLITPIKCPKTLYKERDIERLGKLGRGNFGEVYKVRIYSENVICAMKTLREDVTEGDRESFQKELEMMKSMQHPNIVHWIGTVAPAPGSTEMKILLEFVNQGSLDRLLRKGKVTERGKIKISMQVACGLAYLHRHHIIHRDMAARNILVHADEMGAIVAKVSDFGLSRIDDSGKGYELRRAQLLPLKWLAPECFSLKRWTMASDVWSFGVLVWEVFTDGGSPYGDKTFEGSELSKYVQGGGNPGRPERCRNEIYNVLKACWNMNPEKRPSMDAVTKMLEEIYQTVRETSTKSRNSVVQYCNL